jgi:polyhydroxyalkanoate synthesis regulator phasin
MDMNPDAIFQTVQKGFRVSIGAAGTLIESLQNPQIGEDALNKLRTNPTELADELASRGEVTEQEARTFVDNLMNQARPSGSSPAGQYAAPNNGPSAPADVETDLQDLITQITALRKELADLGASNNP